MFSNVGCSELLTPSSSTFVFSLDLVHETWHPLTLVNPIGNIYSGSADFGMATFIIVETTI
jgi:hypothetical protein